MKNQRQWQRAVEMDGLEETDANTPMMDLAHQPGHQAKKVAEAQLNKIFLARLDVRSRIADLNRNRSKLQARKIDVDHKIAYLAEFDKKLMKREEEISRSLAES